MKKVFAIKLVVVLLAVLAFSVGAGCAKTDLPAFSIKFIDGEKSITVTEKMLNRVELTEFTVESKGVETYYKGLKVSALLKKVKGLTDVNGIVSLLVISDDGTRYGEDFPALPKDNFDNAFFAVLISEDGETYEFLDEKSGPVRLFDQTQGTEVKSIKNVGEVQVNR